MKRVIAVAALLVVILPGSLSAQCSDADLKTLEKLDKAWGEAGDRGDKAFLDNIYAPGFAGHSAWGTVDRATTISTTLVSAERNKKNPQPGPVPDRYLITCSGNTATITHRAIQPPPSGTKAPAQVGRAIHFLAKNGGNWQVVSSTGHLLTDNQQIMYLELDWNDATRRHDSDWARAHYAPFGFEVSSRTGALADRDEAVESMKTDSRIFDTLDLSDLTVHTEGDVAVATGINHAKGRGPDGKPFDRSIRFTDTFIRRDGEWMIWATQGTTLQR